jgi:hypothetical protein
MNLLGWVWLGGLGAFAGVALGGLCAIQGWPFGRVWVAVTLVSGASGFAIFYVWASHRPPGWFTSQDVGSVGGLANGITAAVALPASYALVRLLVD